VELIEDINQDEAEGLRKSDASGIGRLHIHYWMMESK
jgi:hypothetical protein